MSATKCSVPFGRLSIASRLIISEQAEPMSGTDWERSCRRRRSPSGLFVLLMFVMGGV